MSFLKKKSKKNRKAATLRFETLHARSLLTAVGFEGAAEPVEPDDDQTMPTAIVSSGVGEDVEEANGDIREIDWSKTYTPKKDPDLKDPFPDK